MQTMSSLNFYVAKAMLHTVENMKSVLNNAISLTSVILELQNNSSLSKEDYLWNNIANLIDTAKNHAKNLELTLVEEIEMAFEFETEHLYLNPLELAQNEKQIYHEDNSS